MFTGVRDFDSWPYIRVPPNQQKTPLPDHTSKLTGPCRLRKPRPANQAYFANHDSDQIVHTTVYAHI